MQQLARRRELALHGAHALARRAVGRRAQRQQQGPHEPPQAHRHARRAIERAMRVGVRLHGRLLLLAHERERLPLPQHDLQRAEQRSDSALHGALQGALQGALHGALHGAWYGGAAWSVWSTERSAARRSLSATGASSREIDEVGETTELHPDRTAITETPITPAVPSVRSIGR